MFETDPLGNLGALLAAGRALRNGISLPTQPSPPAVPVDALANYGGSQLRSRPGADPQLLAQLLGEFDPRGGRPPQGSSGLGLSQAGYTNGGLTNGPTISDFNPAPGVGTNGLRTPLSGRLPAPAAPVHPPGTMWTQLENPADVTQGAGAMGPTVGDPLIARMAPLRPDNPFGFIIPPNTGKLMKLAGDSSNPGAVVPVDSQEKQAYLEWLVGADRNYVAGAMSSEERAHRDELGESTAILGHFGFVSKQENRRIEDYALLQNPRIRAYLDAVSGAEHADYNTIYGGGTFDDFSKHPSIAITRWGRTSRAAGRYQLEPGTYGDASRVLGMSDFSPPTQDLMAVERLRYRNALGPILSGDVATAINRTRDEWPSLPGGAQRELNSSQFLLNYQKLLQSYAPQ